ncbi:NUMOD4 motif-containing HNH endonuclease [Pinibacter aurantiacus]|uniref:NUMOD4 motif-containing HNH endonuclease n=1 Tax=Pinibacter aurantiacus TaxID=2851599 RepID=A0A9E2SAH2_9BACT|nr:NUMOD4 motif-containing HNH endonuclease [Pinibacter aurantiacus]MBV4357712.1 NUMOD4 motif-containing HNH endonuclease [Pinibacter aurantiacus]
MDEIWRDVTGFEKYYQISNKGNVQSLDRIVYTNKGNARLVKGKLLTSRINNFGYLSVRLSYKGITRTLFMHRLIAQEFIDNPENKPFVNHIDGNKTNNSIENLEWVSHSENISHAYRSGLLNNNRGANHHESRIVVSVHTGQAFYTIKEAANNAQMNYNTFRNLLNSNGNTSYFKA